jgi:hypothetical protein
MGFWLTAREKELSEQMIMCARVVVAKKFEFFVAGALASEEEIAKQREHEKKIFSEFSEKQDCEDERAAYEFLIQAFQNDLNAFKTGVDEDQQLIEELDKNQGKEGSIKVSNNKRNAIIVRHSWKHVLESHKDYADREIMTLHC